MLNADALRPSLFISRLSRSYEYLKIKVAMCVHFACMPILRVTDAYFALFVQIPKIRVLTLPVYSQGPQGLL